ncbi:MAG: phytanoyl-CoA dioxygenase family protein [Nitrospira sp.]
MTISQDPLDSSVIISDEERRKEMLSNENNQLGVMLLHARGYVVLKGAVPESLVADLRSTFNHIFDENLRCLNAGGHAPTTSTGGWRMGQHMEGKDSVFYEINSRFRIFPTLRGAFADPYVLSNPFAKTIIAETLGADYYCKYLSSDTCVSGAITQAPHRDIEFYNEDNVRGCIVNIPIMHCGLHNGPIEVWPGGSHLWRSDKFFKFNLRPFVQDELNPSVEAFASHIPSKKIELKPGELLIRDPGMLHRGTPNPTDEPRTMLTAGYFRRDYHCTYGDPNYNLDDRLFQELAPAIQELFAPFFDKSDPLYWKLRQSRSIRSMMQMKYLGTPIRIGRRWAARIKSRIRAARAV